MNIENIVKLLRLDNEADIYIAYRVIIQKYKTFHRANLELNDYSINIDYRWPNCKRHIRINLAFPLLYHNKMRDINKNPPRKS